MIRYLAVAFVLMNFVSLPLRAKEADPDLPNMSSELIDPACVSILIQDGVDGYQGCLETTEWTPSVEQAEDGFGRDQYVVTGRPQEEGWTLYTTTDYLWERGLVEFVENTGGTGNFSRIVGLPTAEFDGWFATKAGDRCNDGYQKVLSFADSFTYVRTATPFRLLNFESDDDWRSLLFARTLTKDSNENIEDFLNRMDVSRPFRDYAPYDDIAHSANSCVGYVVVSEFSRESKKPNSYGVLVTKKFKEVTWARNDSELNACIAEFFAGLMSRYGVPSFHDDYLYLSGEDLKPALKKMSCPSGNLEKWAQ